MTNNVDPERFESREEMFAPHRREERENATASIAGKLRGRGVRLMGDETSEQVVGLLEAVERFERAVQAQGGDLMVDEGPHGRTLEPDNPHFVLPDRHSDETVPAFLARLEEATRAVYGHPRHGD